MWQPIQLNLKKTATNNAKSGNSSIRQNIEASAENICFQFEGENSIIYRCDLGRRSSGKTAHAEYLWICFRRKQ